MIENSRPILRHYPLGIGAALFLIGMIQAMPHFIFSYQLGVALCGTGAGVGSPMAFAAMMTSHCWGCGVALLGVAVIVVDWLSSRQVLPPNQRMRHFASSGNTVHIGL